jgi:phage gpG-like protein
MAGFPTTQGLRTGFTTQLEFSPSPAIIARDVNKFGMDIRSFREPLMRCIREVLIPSFQQNFAQGGRPPWQALSDVTAELRGSATPILIRSGRLRRTMGQQNIWTVTTEHAVIQSLPAHSWYGAIHQAGNRTKSVTPARPFALIQPQDEERIVEVFDRWLAERAARVGWR